MKRLLIVNSARKRKFLHILFKNNFNVYCYFNKISITRKFFLLMTQIALVQGHHRALSYEFARV
jgi:hypothetical protein